VLEIEVANYAYSQSVQSLLPSHLLPEVENMKIHKLEACLLFCMAVTLGLLPSTKNRISVLENRVIRRIFRSKQVAKRPQIDHSPPTSVEAKNAWSYTPTTPARFHGVHEDSFASADACYHPYS
jgi:hypothetical protein